MECLHCGKKISALRKLQDEEFCSAAHRKAYKKKQEELAVDFLRQSKPRRAKPDAQTPKQQAAAPMEPQPILVLAEMQPESVASCRVDHAPQRNGEWTGISWTAILPASSGLPAPSPCAPPFARVVIRPEVITPRLRLAQKIVVVLGSSEPMLPSVAAQPIWIEPAKQAPVQRPAAEFMSIRPAWVRAGEQHAATPVAVQFSVAPVLAGSDVVLHPVTLELAPSSTVAVAARSRIGSAQEGFAHVWQSRCRTMSMPSAAVALREPCIANARCLTVAKPNVRTRATAPLASFGWRVSAEILHKPNTVLTPRVYGFTTCESVGAAMPRARKFAASTASGLQRSWRVPSEVLHQPAVALTPAARGFTVCEPIAMAAPHARDHVTVASGAIARHAIETAPESPLLGRWRFEFHAAALRAGPHVSAKRMLHKPVSIPIAKAALSLAWKVQVRMGRYARVIPQRPRFEEPLMVAPRPSVRGELRDFATSNHPVRYRRLTTSSSRAFASEPPSTFRTISAAV